MSEADPHFHEPKCNEDLFNEGYYRDLCVSAIKQNPLILAAALERAASSYLRIWADCLSSTETARATWTVKVNAGSQWSECSAG
jgi:hypothetical protein